MARDFKTGIAELWALYGLPPPRFGPIDEIALSLDQARLRLADSDDGRHLLIIAPAGRLSDHPMRRVEQVRSLLQDNLAFLPVRRACVCMAHDKGEPPLIEVMGVHAYDSSLDSLSRTIEDVLSLQERHSASLQGAAAPRRRDSLQRFEQHDVIFQP